MHFFDTHTKGDLVTRLTGDLDMIRHSIAWIIMMVVESCALFLFTVIYFFTLDWLMTLCILALTPILFIVTRMFSKRVGPKYVVLREKLSRLNTKAQENIAANRVVKALPVRNTKRKISISTTGITASIISRRLWCG